MTELEKFLQGKEFNWKPGLQRIKRAVSELSIEGKRSIIVAGTNGKGSTSSLISSILSEHGLKVGLFTSPHIKRINERFRINLKEVDSRELDRAFELTRRIIEKHKLTYFESCFLIALYLFRECDTCIFEVGMGGRLDATNAIKHDLAIITHIDYDHERFLGTTLEKIAEEKLSVAKGIPVVISKNKRKVIEIAKKFSKEIYSFGREFSAEKIAISLDGTDFTYEDRNSSLRLKTSLIGKHQAINASTAIFSSKLFIGNLEEKKISKALRIKLDGRFQILKRKPLIIVDVAHNVDAIRKLIKTLKELSLKVNIIYSGLKDKDVKKILELLHAYTSSVNRKLFVTQIEGERGLTVEEIMANSSPQKVFPIYNLNLSEIEEDTLITGSFYLLSQILTPQGSSTPRP